MLNQPTEDKLHAMRLTAMADAWRNQAQEPKLDELSFDERFASFVLRR